MIYLDYAATSFLKPPEVYRAVSRALLTASSPGRGSHSLAQRAAELVYDCREEAAALFHLDDPSRVVLTFNATHGLNIAIRSCVRPGMRVLVSGYEHNAVMRPLYALGADVRVVGRKLFAPAQVLEDFETHMDGAELVVCTQVSNVFGYVLPLEDIAALCRARGLPLIVDASQAAGVLDVDMNKIGARFIAMPGHKGLFGPQGTGLLLCADEGLPLLYGGAGFDSASRYMPDALPERLEAGTMNVPGIAGLCAGLRYVRQRGTEAIRQEEQTLLELLRERLDGLAELHCFFGPPGTQSGILSFTAPGWDSEELCGALGEGGLALRGGLHCAPMAHESAGTGKGGTVRLSLSPFVSKEQLEDACAIIRKTVEKN